MQIVALVAVAMGAGCALPGGSNEPKSATPQFLREDIPPLTPVPQLTSAPKKKGMSHPWASSATVTVGYEAAPNADDDDIILLPMPQAAPVANAGGMQRDVPALPSREEMVPSSEGAYASTADEEIIELPLPMAGAGEEIVLDAPGSSCPRPGLFAKKKAKKAAEEEEKSLLATFGLKNLKAKKKSRSDIGSNNPCFPRELRMASHPLYVVDPPDVLYIEALQLLPNRPVAGERLVRQDGTISLGYYGQLHVAGLTIAEIEEKLRDRLSEYVQDPQVYVDVAAFNSKVYYVLGQVQQTGRLPITGNETVLDAVTLAGGLTNFAKKKDIHIARPNPGGGCDQILHVDWEAISSCGDTRTNYQLLPGDRVVIPGTSGFGASVVLDNFLTPIERIAALGALFRFTLSDNN
jgi:polysaccharide export outer membrane protein